MEKTAHFKFEIGDRVVERQSLFVYDLTVARFKPDASEQIKAGRAPFINYMTVIERTMQECPGGVQYWYRCQPWGPGRTSQAHSFNEIELDAFDALAWLEKAYPEGPSK